MRRYLPVVIVAALVFGGIYAARLAQTAFGNCALHQSASVNRIVSLAPSVTETVFALGACDKLVGVTRYCDYPLAAKKIAKIGGYIDPSFEAIVRLKPDIVIITTGNSHTAKKLGELGLNVLMVDHNTVSGIIDSITRIGHTVGAETKADEIISDIRKRIEDVKQRTGGLKRPSVIISIGRSMGSGIGEIYVAGKDNIYDEIIGIIGGRNAYDSEIFKTPSLSGEGITRLNPDVIIDLAPDKQKKDVEKSISEWNMLSNVSAVKNKSVYALAGDYVVIPGPRFINTLEDAAKVVHPEADWSYK